jgi:hypothetical protein
MPQVDDPRSVAAAADAEILRWGLSLRLLGIEAQLVMGARGTAWRTDGQLVWVTIPARVG